MSVANLSILSTVPAAAKLTPRQRDVLVAILYYRREFHFMPTLAEIGIVLEINKASVFEHVEALVKKGALRRLRKQAYRNLAVCDAFDPDRQPKRQLRLEAAGRACEAIADRLGPHHAGEGAIYCRKLLAEWEGLR